MTLKNRRLLHERLVFAVNFATEIPRAALHKSAKRLRLFRCRAVAKPLCVAFVLNTLSAAPALAHRALSMPWLRWFGVCSYSLYLWHPPVQELAMVMGLPRWGAFGAAVALGAASFYLFEDPLRKYIRDRGQTRLSSAVGSP